ncbi:single-stranded-DNA-specific exonuclease RecJ [Leisingera caerulea]|uniref:single-stranded-DNA-specific exonuclease RecJ n=1 Tax=Leisingera caerulea TaxID=506591 RepID=UPI0004233F7D|nr:single-stranded-DNA-specific exonuclease RecJ [Leisingera caerulea]
MANVAETQAGQDEPPAETAEQISSFKGRVWELPEVPAAKTVTLKNAGANPLLAKILAVRGMDAGEFPDYVKTLIKDTMPDPFAMQDMEKGAKRVAQAIRDKQRIGVWSDYDVDGAASAGLFIEALRLCGHRDAVLRIPDRIKEGYGPNAKGLLEMQKDEGCDLICCLDAGIVAFEPLKAAAAAGIEMVVIDHHNADQSGKLPEGYAIINPNRLDDTSGLGHLCAAGVTFCFFVAVVRELREAGYFDGKDGRPQERPELMNLLDLVALATICDVMKLYGLNRAFVMAGVKLLSARRHPGIAALARAAGIKDDEPIDERSCGWVLGPRINAGGRVGASDSGARLLIAEDPGEIEERAQALHAINVERKELSDAVTEAALQQLEGMLPGRDRRLAFAVVEDAHEGVVGISAGKAKEAKDAPAIVVTRDHQGNLKGSARSLADVNIGHIIQDAAAEGVILGGGGHGMAGGLNLRDDQIDGFVAFADAQIRKTEYFREGVRSRADLEVQLKELSVAAIESLGQMRPFGNGNEVPNLIVKSVVLEGIRLLKEKHFKLTFKSGPVRVDGLIWGVAGTPLADTIEAHLKRTVDVLCTAEINEFNGNRSPQLMIEDIRPALDVLEEPQSSEAGLAADADDIVALAAVDMEEVEINQGTRRMSLVTGVRVDAITDVKGKHLKVMLSDGDRTITALKWNAIGTEKEDRMRKAEGGFVNLLGELEINEWRGKKSLQIKLKDFEAHQEALI